MTDDLVKAFRRRLTDLRLIHGFGFRRDDLEVYRFGVDRDVESATDFLGYKTYRGLVRPALNASHIHPLFENKWIFYRLAHSFGLPIPRTYGLFDEHFGTSWDGRSMRTVDEAVAIIAESRPVGLVIKPNGGLQGQQITIIEQIDHKLGIGVSRGETVEIRHALDHLGTSGMHDYQGFILQEKVDQHPVLHEIAPDTSNTLRIVTMLTKRGEVEVNFTIARFGRVGAVVDGWTQGGLAANVQRDGRLGLGRFKPAYGLAPTDTHPDSHRVFTGLQVPFFSEAVTLCCDAARLFPGARWIGWDVLITEDGPVILEANSDWGLQSVQSQTSGLLAQPGVRDELVRHGVTLPSGDVAEIARSLVRTTSRRWAKRVKRRLSRRS